MVLGKITRFSLECPFLGSWLPPLSLEARLVRAIRKALTWSGQSRAERGTAAGGELSQMEDEQITRIKKERREGGRRIFGLAFLR